MKKLLITALVIFLLFSMTACRENENVIQFDNTAPENSSPIAVATETSEAEDEVPTETSSKSSPQPETGPVQPGYYLVSSVGRDGDITFYDTADQVNGYLKLEKDHTGTMNFDGVTKTLTWDDEALYRGEEILPCISMSYYDSELGRDDFLLVVYFLNSETSVIFRLAEEPAQ